MLKFGNPLTSFAYSPGGLRNDTLATKQIPDTLPKAQLVTPREMKVDVLVIGAGPTGLACGIEALRAGFKVIVVGKGCVVNLLFNYSANMTVFTTPELF